MNTLLLSQFAVEHPEAEPCQDPFSASDAFEANGASWTLPDDVDALCIDGDPFRVLLPIDSEELANELLHLQQAHLRWSLFPDYQLEILTTVALQTHVHAIYAKGIDVEDKFMLKKRPAQMWKNILRAKSNPAMRRYFPYIEDALRAKGSEASFNLIPRVLPGKTIEATIHTYPFHRASWHSATVEERPQPALWQP